jgi:hypothetical protein
MAASAIEMDACASLVFGRLSLGSVFFVYFLPFRLWHDWMPQTLALKALGISLSFTKSSFFFSLAALERAGLCERRPLPSAHTWTHPYLWPSFCFLILQVSFFIEKKHRKRQGGREKTKEKEASQGSCCCCSNYSENITSGNVVNTWALLVNHNK